MANDEDIGLAQDLLSGSKDAFEKFVGLYLDDPKRRWSASRWEFYSAPAPWGPWTLFHTHDNEPDGFYKPSIPAKFISDDGRKL